MNAQPSPSSADSSATSQTTEAAPHWRSPSAHPRVAAARHRAEAREDAPPPAPSSTDREPGELPVRGSPLVNPGLVAIAVWLVLIAPAVAIPRLIPFDGWGVKGLALPLAAGLAGGVVILGLAWWRRGAPWVAGAAGGLLAIWLTLMLGTGLRGTPFGYYGLTGDAGQLSAMAMRYSVTAASADPLLTNTPAEYPPLFPWSVGRVAALIDVPAWQLVGTAQVIFTGLALLLGFVLWQRIVPAWIALATTALGLMVFSAPQKAFEMLTLAMFVPWALATFARPSRGRLHWLAAGVVAGVIVLTYYGWMIFGAIGLVAIGVATLRAESTRRAYLLYLAKVVGVAFVVSSWFVVPYLLARFTMGGEAASDRYADAGLIADIFPFIAVTPLAILQLAGVVGLVWLRGSARAWWASPMLAMVLGAYAFRALGALAFVLTGHTWLSHYTPRLYSTVLAMAGVLTLVHAVPRLLDRLAMPAPKGAPTVVLSIALAWCGLTYTIDWTPGAPGRFQDIIQAAYVEPLPDGTYVDGLPDLERKAWFPVDPIREEVEEVYGGPNRDHVALSVDERLFSFLPWPGYTGNNPGGALAHTDERLAELRRLAAITDPAEFARASASTAFGPIDIFALRATDAGWQWSAYVGFDQDMAVVAFQPTQFSRSDWVITYLPANTVLAVRRP